MATQAVTSGDEKINGGSVFHAGNVSSDSPVTNSVTIVSTVDDLRDIGSKIVAKDGTLGSTTDSAGVTKAVSGGTLAHSASSTQWVMRGGQVTTTLAGTAYTGFATPGADFNGKVKDDIHQLTSTRHLGSGVSTEFDYLATPSTEITPNFTKGGGAGTLQNFVQMDGTTAATDDAATPTRSVPGELTYRTGAADPVTDEYKAKNVREA